MYILYIYTHTHTTFKVTKTFSMITVIKRQT